MENLGDENPSEELDIESKSDGSDSDSQSQSSYDSGFGNEKNENDDNQDPDKANEKQPVLSIPIPSQRKIQVVENNWMDDEKKKRAKMNGDNHSQFSSSQSVSVNINNNYIIHNNIYVNGE